MFAYEPPLSPPSNEWKDYTLPLLCHFRMQEVCQDILNKGESTIYPQIYAAIYELIEPLIEQENSIYDD